MRPHSHTNTHTNRHTQYTAHSCNKKVSVWSAQNRLVCIFVVDPTRPRVWAQCSASFQLSVHSKLDSPTSSFLLLPTLSLFTQVIKIELKDTNGNAYSSTSSPSFPSFSGSASSAESYQSQRHNVKYFAGYARFNQCKQSAQELLMCVVCVCSSVYKYNM